MKKNNPKTVGRKYKIYMPKKGQNLEEFSKRIERLSQKIEKNERLAEMKEHALFEYITLMTNFASHDLKNAIHNLDGYINTLDINNVKEDDIKCINGFISNIRKTIEDFKTMAPDESKTQFTISELGNSLELLNRGILNSENISVNYEYDKNNLLRIHQSLHNVIQMVNNLIINSIKALHDCKEKKLYICIKLEKEDVIIVVSDNGCGIKTEYKDKIFDLHFSTTNGSGIGLYHVKYIAESMNGSVQYQDSPNEYKTVFTIKFPQNESIDLNN